MARAKTEDGYPHPASAAVTAAMKGNRRRDTRPELLVRSELHRLGLRFRKDFPVITPERTIRVDVAFTRKRLALFVDGCFWHSCPQHGRVPRGNNLEYWKRKLDRNVTRDRTDELALASAGWTVVRIWEHVPAPEAAALTAAVLDQLSPWPETAADHPLIHRFP